MRGEREYKNRLGEGKILKEIGKGRGWADDRKEKRRERTSCVYVQQPVCEHAYIILCVSTCTKCLPTNCSATAIVINVCIDAHVSRQTFNTVYSTEPDQTQNTHIQPCIELCPHRGLHGHPCPAQSSSD